MIACCQHGSAELSSRKDIHHDRHFDDYYSIYDHWQQYTFEYLLPAQHDQYHEINWRR
ncbi:MAG: hypothetical protein ACR5K4_03780 [Sodalis sp. (in: enterobacteria)]